MESKSPTTLAQAASAAAAQAAASASTLTVQQPAPGCASLDALWLGTARPGAGVPAAQPALQVSVAGAIPVALTLTF